MFFDITGRPDSSRIFVYFTFDLSKNLSNGLGNQFQMAQRKNVNIEFQKKNIPSHSAFNTLSFPCWFFFSMHRNPKFSQKSFFHDSERKKDIGSPALLFTTVLVWKIGSHFFLNLQKIQCVIPSYLRFC